MDIPKRSQPSWMLHLDDSERKMQGFPTAHCRIYLILTDFRLILGENRSFGMGDARHVGIALGIRWAA